VANQETELLAKKNLNTPSISSAEKALHATFALLYN